MNSLNGDNVEFLTPYDITADSYDTLYSREQWRKYSIALSTLKIGFDDRILDAGCGTCLFYEYLVSEKIDFQYYIGLDISIGMLEKCIDKQVFIDPRVDIVLGDLEKPPLRKSVFTRIFAFTVLDLVDRDRVLGLLRELLDRGTIVYTLLKRRGCSPGIENGLDVKDCIYLLAT